MCFPMGEQRSLSFNAAERISRTTFTCDGMYNLFPITDALGNTTT